MREAITEKDKRWLTTTDQYALAQVADASERKGSMGSVHIQVIGPEFDTLGARTCVLPARFNVRPSAYDVQQHRQHVCLNCAVIEHSQNLKYLEVQIFSWSTRGAILTNTSRFTDCSTRLSYQSASFPAVAPTQFQLLPLGTTLLKLHAVLGPEPDDIRIAGLSTPILPAHHADATAVKFFDVQVGVSPDLSLQRFCENHQLPLPACSELQQRLRLRNPRWKNRCSMSLHSHCTPEEDALQGMTRVQQELGRRTQALQALTAANLQLARQLAAGAESLS